ncbi:MAG: hypothetical protein PHC60_09535, partial [Heliobacteriaceae bacterium]|nr:hypothetical protein [Heliobacteriaceae bacterium]
DTILRYIKDGRIESSSFTGTVLTCERCGGAVSGGRLCADCQSEMMREFQQAANSLKPASQTPGTTVKGKDRVYSAELKDRLK